MINHTVSFKLKHPSGSEAENRFLEDSKEILEAIAQVIDFKVLKQVSSKCGFDFCFSMYFESQQDFDGYNKCEAHQNYVKDIWLSNVEEFLEQDFLEL